MNKSLDRRHSLPTGAVVGDFTLKDGWKLRTIRSENVVNTHGSLLFLTGRGDFLEKYAESFHDFADAGWNFASFDWRGQGLSGRQGDTAMKGHSPGFANWLGDLDQMIDWFEGDMPRPWFVVGHSMGGHLLLRHLGESPRQFDRAVLLAPLLGMRAKPLGPGLARLLARVMTALGLGGRYVVGGGDYAPGGAGSIRQHLLTTDPDRYADEAWWVAQNPALALGSVTFGWLDAAFRSCDALFRDALGKVATPVLILTPAEDGLVDVRATQRAAALLPDARLETVDAAGHELLREITPIRTRVLARLLTFLETGA